jgi:hypothetical protein
VQPESKRIKVFRSGRSSASNVSMPFGGQVNPVAAFGNRLASKKAQKNAEKNITSDAINNAMPYRRPI